MAPFGIIGDLDKNTGKGQGIRKRDIASYMLLPKVLPRIGELFFTGFYFFAFFMAQVYRGVRLLPADHPSLNPSNIGNYGVRDIIGEAARHLVWRKENIDQIIVFLAILAGLGLLVLQAATFMIAFAVPQAVAAPAFGFSSIFGVPVGGGTQDIAFILLDRVFGVPGIFNSCISLTGTPCAGVDPVTLNFDSGHPVYKPDVFPWPYHHGLHALFSFYSTGLLLVAVFILLYFVVVIVAETAQTGTPFGKRFNTVWAPIRLVMAFGLLIPITNGLNSAQYITLYAAKWGSNFASNGWIVFNQAINQNAQNSAANMAQNMDLVVKPKEPDAAALLQFMTLAHTCKVFEETIMADPQINEAESKDAKCGSDLKGRKIDAYLVKPGFDSTKSQQLLRSTSYDDAIKFAQNADIQIRFGDRSCKNDFAVTGNVQPTCGEIVLPITSTTQSGAKTVQKGYYELIQYLWGGFSDGTATGVKSYRNDLSKTDKRPELNACQNYNDVLQSSGSLVGYDKSIRTYALAYFQNGIGGDRLGQCNSYDKTTLLQAPPAGWTNAALKSYMYGNEADSNETSTTTKTTCSPDYPGCNQNAIIRNVLKNGVVAMRAAKGSEYAVSQENLRRGWATAGIWYNKIAEMNGALIGASWNLPAPSKYPDVMMKVMTEKAKVNVRTSPTDMFCPNIANGSIQLPGGKNGSDYAQAMCQVYKTWDTQGRTIQPTGNALSDFGNSLFGTQGLFDLRYAENQRAHPLALLVGVGKSLIEASIRNLVLGGVSGLGQMVSGVFGSQALPEAIGAFSSFFFSIATMTLTAGFILFYVIPFLPFLYFFFAVGNWLKGVFEAMVGVPLWALAHIRIDGNGLPGDAAINGYFMLFEIFLRPILILFGFLASITIFAAMASVLHEIFEVAIANLTGAGSTTGVGKTIDKFFYTVMYAVIMYIMALSSFKLIDLIPNQIMRWMGSSVSTFSDMQGNAAENLTQMTAVAGNSIVGGMTSGMQSVFKAGSQATSAASNAVKSMGKGPGQ